jgi:uncharacterized protein
MYRLFKVVSISCFVLAGAAVNAGAASFDCTRAGRPAEKLVCADKGLSGLDSVLARMYAKRQEVVVDPAITAADQKAWLRDVRDKCTDIKCLRSAYGKRIARFNEENASFDCDKASIAAQKLICGAPSLRAADLGVGKAFRAARLSAPDPDRLNVEQTSWTRDVRDRCTNEACLSKALAGRANSLQLEKVERLAAIAKKVGYSRRTLYSDLIIWSGDRGRSIAAFASQDSTQNSASTEAQPDEDVLLDIYVIDTASGNVLQRVTDKLPSVGITIRGLRFDTKDYAALLHAPSFGLLTEYANATGCDDNYGTGVRVYSLIGQSIVPVIRDVVTENGRSTCHLDCSGQEVYRTLRLGPASKATFADLTVVEDTEMQLRSDTSGECVATGSQKEYLLHFDGSRYAIPQQLQH